MGPTAPPRNPRLTAIPAARSSAPVLKIRLFLVLGSLLASALAGVGAMVAWATYQPPLVDVAAVVPRGRGLASLVARSYVSGQAVPVPAAASLIYSPPSAGVFAAVTEPEWDGFVRYTVPAGTFERHSFLFHRTVPGPDGAVVDLFELVVYLSVPADGTPGNPALAAAPSVLPAPHRNSSAVADYSDSEAVGNLPAEARQLLEGPWVRAFATNNGELLLQYSGEADPAYRYVGLGGFSEASTLRVQTAIDRGGDSWLVRARVRLVGANELSAEMDIDVTIEAASTATPKIVAWGPAGSGALGPDAVRVPANQ